MWVNNQRSLADKTLVLVGAGHSNIALIRQFMMDPIVGVRLIVVSPQSVSPYSGMLPGFLAGHYQLDELFVDVAALCKRAGARFIRGSLATIDAQQKTIWIQHGAFSDAKPLAVHYDYAVLNTGAAPANSFPSTHPHCYYVKPIHELLSALPMIDKALEGHEKSLVIAGGGAAGLELAFAFRARYHPSTKISLVAKHRLERDAALQSGASLIRKALKKRSIHLLEEISVDEALEQSVALSNGENIDADVICAATPVNPPDWIEESGLPTEKGFLKVDSYLQLEGCDGLYAAGDIVHMNTPRGRSGVMAVRAGQYLADALWRQLAQRLSDSALKSIGLRCSI